MRVRRISGSGTTWPDVRLRGCAKEVTNGGYLYLVAETYIEVSNRSRLPADIRIAATFDVTLRECSGSVMEQRLNIWISERPGSSVSDTGAQRSSLNGARASVTVDSFTVRAGGTTWAVNSTSVTSPCF
jgi:hypothetical protein